MQTPTAERPSALRTWLAIFLTAVLAVVGSVMFAPAERADAAALPPSILEGGYLISDAEFFDGNSMTASQIQSFLNSQVGTCRAAAGNPTCLKNFKGTLPSKSADKYCKAVSGKSNATAAEIIDRVAAACSINPKVILVMLQKEQGLVTSSAPSSWAYQAAMGQSCPDTAPCDAAAAGFVNQVYLGARQMQVYTMNPTWWNYRAGQVNTIQWHPNRSCGTSQIYIQNQATANLYIYTPYRPNVAALSAGYGTGDACSTYGNRNFYNYYVDWFALDASSSTGAPAQTAACQLPLNPDVASRAGSATVKIDNLNVRTAPTLKCGTGMTQLDKGDAVTITGAYGAWTRATVGSRTMWMYSSYLNLPTTGAPAGGSDACAQPTESSIEKANGEVVVTTSVLNARSAPSTSCDAGRTQLSQGDIGTRTGVYGAWWRVTMSGKTYWLHSDYVAVVPGSEVVPPPASSACAAPANPASAKRTYVVTLPQVKGRTGPSAACDDVVVTLKRGAVATANAVSADRQWLRVRVGSDDVWIARRAVGYASASHVACAPPEGAVSASKAYVVTVPQVEGRRGPSAACDDVVVTLQRGAVVTANAVSADRQWLRVRVGSDDVWVARGSVGYASASHVACAPPEGAVSASKAYVVTVPQVEGRRGPSAACDDVVVTLQRGAVVTANAVSADRQWLRVRVGSDDVWVARGSVGYASASHVACAPPEGAVSASKAYVVTVPQVEGRRGPSAACDDVVVTLQRGAVVTANAVSADRQWLRVRVGSDDVWVARGSVGYASASHVACAPPEGAVSASKAYVVTVPQVEGRRGPSAACDDVVATLQRGAVVTANAVSADRQWLRVRVGSDDVWVARGAVGYAPSS